MNNRELVEKLWVDLYNRDFDAVGAAFTDDGEYTDMPTPADDVARGPEQIAARLRLGLEPLSGISHDIRVIVAEGDVIVTEHVEHWEWPSGERASLPFVSMHEARDGKLVRWWDYWDLATLMNSAPAWWVEHIMSESARIGLRDGVTMAIAQPGIFAQGTRSHRHLEFDAHPGVEPEAVLAALAELRQPSVTAGGANIVVGFRPTLWRQLDANGGAIDDFVLPELDGLARTPHDVWVWTHGTGEDVMLDVARAVGAMLAPVATLATDLAGFVYHDGRDLTGFIDGTENPPVEAANEVAILPLGAPGAGGSYAITQRWVHDLTAFHALSIEDQQRVFGRTKPDSIELDDDAKPDTAHIARVVIEEDGEELEIYRRSVPYGHTKEHGLYFVAFSADPTRFEKMLRRMFAGDDGLHDRLTEFSRPVSGSTYFVPSVEALGNVFG